MRKHEEAEECYKKACDIREEGHQRVRGLFGKGLALTYGNYAYLLGVMKKTDQAKKLIEKSIKIKEQDASKAIPASMHTLAMSWDNYGMILYYSADESKEQEAGQWFEKAIRQKKELVSKDYLTYAPSLAQSYFHYARLLSKDKEKMQLAKSCLEKAIEIQEAREKDNQGYLTQDLAESYHVLAVVL